VCARGEQADGDPAPDERRLRLGPADGGSDLLDVADEVGVERLAARADLLARGAQVLAAHVERIEAGPARDLVDLRLADPLQVRGAEGAVGAGGREIRVDAGCIDAVGGPAVRPGSGVAAGGDDTRAVVGVRAGVEQALAVRIRHHMLCRRVVTIDSETRFWIRTGRPALRASATVSGSIFVYDFDPKPPPR
jgi:hypothetical protein